MKQKRTNTRIIFVVLAITCLILFFIDLLTGGIFIPANEVFSHLFTASGNTANWISIHEFRIPRLITAMVAGVALSVSGLQMQTVFQNPLAGPYVLGISSGAGLGVALVVLGLPGIALSAYSSSAGSLVMVAAAWLGAAGVLLLILSISMRVQRIMTILILGIMLSSGISALISIMQYFSPESALKSFVIWTMGSLGGVSRSQLPLLLSGFAAGLVLAILSLKPSQAMMLGEDYARTMGVRSASYRLLLFSSTALLTGTVTAFCGPIGFIGIAVPHISRMIMGAGNFNRLFLTSILVGISIMLFADILSQLPGRDVIIPINAISSLIGIPVVIWIVLKRKNRMS